MTIQGKIAMSGIGGSGMSGLADILTQRGCEVTGSDRNRNTDIIQLLQKGGIRVYPQDGSVIQSDTTCLIRSNAVEDTNPDVIAAANKGIKIIKRGQAFAEIFNEKNGIGIAGTSGKTTVTAMIGVIFQALNTSPTILNGGVMLNFTGNAGSMAGNALNGTSDVVIGELDESEDSIGLNNPWILVVNNITQDHKDMAALREDFTGLLKRTREAAVINLDDPEAAALVNVHTKNVITFGIERNDATLSAWDIQDRHWDYQTQDWGVSFTLKDNRDGASYPVVLSVPGRHNVENALAALGAASAARLSIKNACHALKEFKGTRRREEILGINNGITVIDSFGHNPSKAGAALDVLTHHKGKLLLVFQMHGFKPARDMRDSITTVFANTLRTGDMLLMPEIYYVAGSNAVRNISAADLVADVNRKAGRECALFFPDKAGVSGRDEILAYLKANAQPGDIVCVMGARDDSLTTLGYNALRSFDTPAAVQKNGTQP
jgi:UDP-N-acetylmuramate--alanine ligase